MSVKARILRFLYPGILVVKKIFTSQISDWVVLELYDRLTDLTTRVVLYKPVAVP